MNSHTLATKKYYQKVRRSVIETLGGKCACCGEANYCFLTIDHIVPVGTKDRPKGQMLPFVVRKEGYPKDKYQVLCWNCNLAKQIYGVCPHLEVYEIHN